MAIKSAVGESGFADWDAWSRQAASYDPQAAREVWRSLRADGAVGIGSLFHIAKANGWSEDGDGRRLPRAKRTEAPCSAAEHASAEAAEIARERADTAARAAAIWEAATAAGDNHPYLARKQVAPVSTLREIEAGQAAMILGYAPRSGGQPLTGRLLVIPVQQDERLSTLELIDGDGRKAALIGRGTKVGGYWATEPLPAAPDTLLIGEDVATVLSVRQASGQVAVAALSAGNLPAVAQAMRQRFPTARLVILADLVKVTGEPDPHAIQSASAVGGHVSLSPVEDRASRNSPEHGHAD